MLLNTIILKPLETLRNYVSLLFIRGLNTSKDPLKKVGVLRLILICSHAPVTPSQLSNYLSAEKLHAEYWFFPFIWFCKDNKINLAMFNIQRVIQKLVFVRERRKLMNWWLVNINPDLTSFSINRKWWTSPEAWSSLLPQCAADAFLGPLSLRCRQHTGPSSVRWDTLRIPGSSYIKGHPHSSTPLPFSMHRVSILISWLIV